MDKNYFTNLVKGFEDKKVTEDPIYQDNIEGIEKSYKGSTIDFLSKDTIIQEPFYSNMFQALINNEAEKRFVKNFYHD